MQTDHPEREIPTVPVYADDLKTVIGAMVDGVGFVPAGTDPGESTLTTIEQPSEADG